MRKKGFVMRHRLSSASQHSRDVSRAVGYSLACVALVTLAPELAHADPEQTAMGNVLCKVVDMVYGNLGRGLATLAVIIIGVGATLGKVSWGLAITVGVGISVIFNAENIVDLLDAGSDMNCEGD